MMRQRRNELYCKYADCTRPARGDTLIGGYCYTHTRRASKRIPMSAPIREQLPPLERLVSSAIAVGNAHSEEFERAKERLRKAAVRYVASLPIRKRRAEALA